MTAKQKHQEHILAAPSGLFDLEGNWLDLRNSDVVIAQRAGLEHNPQFRQLLPYGVIKHGNKVGVYQRMKGGGESRLYGKHSIGVGGHVSIADVVFDPVTEVIDLEATLHKSMLREINEEFGITHDMLISITPITRYLVSNKTDVDSVHVGLPFLLEVNTDNIRSHEEEIEFLGFYDLADLDGNEQMETWSELLIKRGTVKAMIN